MIHDKRYDYDLFVIGAGSGGLWLYAASGTRKEHLLMPDREFKTVTALRRRLMAVPPHAQIEQLLAACQRFESNELMVGGAS